MILYSLRSADGEWRITKFDEDLNQESSYIVSTEACECPQWQGRERQCRHMKMLPMMVERADSPWFFCYEDAQWYDPTGEAQRDEPLPEDVVAGQSGSGVASVTIPEGITVVSLRDPETLHNTIAVAVGEPVVSRSVVANNPYPNLKRRI